MHSRKPVLVLIQSTDSPIELHLEKGIWDRQKFSLTEYAQAFDVLYYTSDINKYQDIMPNGVTHKSANFIVSLFGLRHILYYCFLFFSAFKWRKQKNALVRVIGVNVPVVPLLKKISKKKFVISYQFDWANGMKKDYKGIKPLVSGSVQSLVINSANRLICTTQWLADIANQRYFVERAKITIIPNYVNTSVFKPTHSKKKQIVFAGRLHWSKGIDTLIRAFNKFHQENPEYKLIVIGTGEEEATLKKLVADQDSVLFTGSVRNSIVAQYFSESEIFVLPTVNMEGHPKALVEAMAAGCKCITSDVPGNNHVLIESNSSDLLFPSQDVEGLYQKLIYASTLTHNNQYQFALKSYSSTVCFEREFALLKSLLTA